MDGMQENLNNFNFIFQSAILFTTHCYSNPGQICLYHALKKTHFYMTSYQLNFNHYLIFLFLICLTYLLVFEMEI